MQPLSEKETKVGLILIFVASAMLVASLPKWSYSRDWGYHPSGVLSIAVILLAILLVIGYIPWGF